MNHQNLVHYKQNLALKRLKISLISYPNYFILKNSNDLSGVGGVKIHKIKVFVFVWNGGESNSIVPNLETF